MAKRGRPKGRGKPEVFDQHVSEVMTLRFTPEQRAYLERKAEIRGGTVPSYLRWLVEELRTQPFENTGDTNYPPDREDVSNASDQR